MLVEFGANNFFSFKEGFCVSFLVNKQISDTLVIKGANASGKTNVFKVLSFLNFFTINSFTSMKPDEEMLLFSFFHNDEPISLYAQFIDDNIEYKYELELTKNSIISEIIYKKNRRWAKVVERKGKKLIKCSEEYKALKTISLERTNASIISIAKQYEIKSLDKIYNLFNNIETNVNSFGKSTLESSFPNYTTVSSIYNETPKLLKFVIDMLKRADTGIENIIIKKMTNLFSNKDEYIPIFEYKISDKTKQLTYQEQSNGVKSLYLQLGLYAITLDQGMVLALDEFDINLHPDLLPMLIDLFEDKEINKNNAQFIFSTHHTSIMDKLGKYKIILVNKDDNESFLYRLDEIPGDILRPDRAITPAYRSNKVGGKPRIDYEKKI